jgi:signal transduction histidine kinase
MTRSLSLLWRILLPTSAAITLLFGITGYLVQSYVAEVSKKSLEGEVNISLHAYQALWADRARDLASISRVMSSMSDVRAAFATRDSATIRDVAEQLWSQVSEQDASFLVLEPTGQVIASLGGQMLQFTQTAELVQAAVPQFPKQSSGYVVSNRRLYYVVLTPVYVQAGTEQALLNILLVAFGVNDKVAAELKRSTGGTDFAFVAGDYVIASTLPVASTGSPDSVVLKTPLNGMRGISTAELVIIRSFAGPKEVISELQRTIALIWLLAIAAGIVLTYLLTKRILRPVANLDRAAEEVIKQNYSVRVPIETRDELGRLAQTFNLMCDSIQSAREDLIRQERISTIGRLSTSIVHDLRNPLAAIYGGAEMLVDAELSPEQYKRLAANIYRASRNIQELLQELLDVSRVSSRAPEAVKLAEIVNSAADSIARAAETQRVALEVNIPPDLAVMADHDRIERVFLNLMTNALEAMPEGGKMRITCAPSADSVTVHFDDTGAGISEEAWSKLFQPFSSFGKKNGLGLGLALSRQTVLEHGGDLWAERLTAPGARFNLRLPIARN